jgi:multiple sugar transport system substrate-binding protein
MEEQRMRRLPSVLLTIGIGITLWIPAAQAAHTAAAACPAKGTVSFMFWGDKGEYGEQSAVIKQAEAACPGLHVNAVWDQGNYDNDLATKIGSGNAPDVFQLDGSKRLPEFVTEGALLDLTSYIKQDKLNLSQLFYPACLPETMYNGHIYGLMRDCGNQGMLIFNKDMFDARHVAYPNASWTFKDLLAAAEKISGNYSLPTDPTRKLRFGIGVQTDDYRMNQYMWDWGGDWLSPDLKTCTMTGAAAQTGLQWWHDLAWVHHGAPTPEQQSTVGDPVGGFSSQRYAMAFVGPWALDYLVKPSAYTGNKPVAFKWGVTLNPNGPASRASLVSAGIEVASVHTKNPVAAYWLIKYLTMGSGTQIEAKYGIGIPGFKQISTTPAYVNEYQPYASVWLQGMTSAGGRAMRLVPQYDKFIDSVTTALKPFWSNSQSVQQATAAACAAVKPLLP